MKIQEILTTGAEFFQIAVGPSVFVQKLPVALVFLVSLVFSVFMVLISRYILRLKKSLTVPSVFLELTPPAKTEQQSYTTEQLFSLIHGLGRQISWYDRLIGYTPVVSLEILSTYDEGIRYLVRVPKNHATTLKRSLMSYLPNMSVKIIGEIFSLKQLPGTATRIAEFALINHFAYPLKKQNELTKHDPIAYITGMMTQLQPDEIVSIQLVLTAVRSADAHRISRLILFDGNVLEFLNKKQSILIRFLQLGAGMVYLLVALPLWFIADLLNSGGAPFPKLPYSKSKHHAEKTAYEQELTASIHAKNHQPLFKGTIRVSLSGSNKKRLSERMNGLRSSFSTYSSYPYQAIMQIRFFRFSLFQRYLRFLYGRRLFSLASRSLFSVSEISDIYHFPYTKMTKTEDMVKIHSTVLPAPLALKKSNHLNISFAKNTYGGATTMIGLTEEERRRHMYILGATGTGKSTLLLSMVGQDMKNGKGLCVIDPHGDLIEKILPTIPDDRIDDVIYFNPDDIGYPIGINLLELSPGLTGDDRVREKEAITESIISLFHKLYADKYSGPRMEYILRNTIHTAFTNPNPTLFTVYKLLINTPFRKSVVARLQDENLKDFWKYEFGKAGDYQKVKMISPITNKIGRFLFSPTAKRILEKEHSTISFDNILDSGKILLCNLAKGKIGEDTSEVFGILLMAKIQLAALKRARTSIEDRRDFYLYVDEFQNFATPAFAQILSEARKYRLNAILAHQTTSQLDDRSLVNVTLANTGTVICFRTANPEDERLILPQFAPYIQQGEIASLPSFHFYMKINAINPEEPFSGETIPINITLDSTKMNEIILRSRNLYAEPYVPSETHIATLKKSISKKPISSTQTLLTLP